MMKMMMMIVVEIALMMMMMIVVVVIAIATTTIITCRTRKDFFIDTAISVTFVNKSILVAIAIVITTVD